MNQATAQIGDRVLIAGRHPWHGPGEIAGPFDGGPLAGLDWTVRLDNGFECAASSIDLKLLERVA